MKVRASSLQSSAAAARGAAAPVAGPIQRRTGGRLRKRPPHGNVCRRSQRRLKRLGVVWQRPSRTTSPQLLPSSGGPCSPSHGPSTGDSPADSARSCAHFPVVAAPAAPRPTGPSSTLPPAGAYSARIDTNYWIVFNPCCAQLVAAGFSVSVKHNGHRPASPPPSPPVTPIPTPTLTPLHTPPPTPSPPVTPLEAPLASAFQWTDTWSRARQPTPPSSSSSAAAVRPLLATAVDSPDSPEAPESPDLTSRRSSSSSSNAPSSGSDPDLGHEADPLDWCRMTAGATSTVLPPGSPPGSAPSSPHMRRCQPPDSDSDEPRSLNVAATPAAGTRSGSVTPVAVTAGRGGNAAWHAETGI